MRLISVLAAAAALSAAPASAVVTTFASFNAQGNGNIVFVNDGSGGTNTTYRSNGTGGSLYTTTTTSGQPSQSTPGALSTTFSFLLPALASVSNTPAIFTFSGTVTSTPAFSAAGFTFQEGLTGTFSFVSVDPITIGSTFYAPGSNLLSGSFNNLAIVGGNLSTSGSASVSTASGGTITYTSDFLTFGATNDRDLSMSLTAINSLVSNVNKGLNFVQGNALRSFRATTTGSFSSDPAPRVTANVPEPAVWLQLIAGFGLVGMSARRRKVSAAA